MHRKIIGRFLLKMTGILIFCVISVYALFLAYGYQYDIVRRDIKKTSIIDLSATENNVEVFLNGTSLHHGNLPYQIKGVVPGAYRLLLKKDGFLNWMRALQVKADFVSKVSDILLIPQNINQFARELIRFASETQFTFGNDFMIVRRPVWQNSGEESYKTAQNYLTIIIFNNDGTIRQHEIALPELSGSIKGWQDNTSQLAFSSRLTFVYYVANNDLYRLSLGAVDAAGSVQKVRKGVERFALTKDGIYYVSSGMLYYSDFDGERALLLDGSFRLYNHLRAIFGRDYAFVILNNFLYLARSETILEPIMPVRGEVFFNNFDQILFSDDKNQLFIFDPRLNEKILLNRFTDGFRLWGWFDDWHFIYQVADVLYLADVSFSNVYKLDLGKNPAGLYVKNRVIFYVNGELLKVLKWW